MITFSLTIMLLLPALIEINLKPKLQIIIVEEEDIFK